jgi:hypothetical protein
MLAGFFCVILHAMNKYIILAVVILGIGMGIWSYKFHSSPRPLLTPPEGTPLPPGYSASQNSPASNPSKVYDPPKAEGVRPEFVAYLKNEAKQINAPKTDSERALTRGEDQANLMGPTEIIYAKELVLAPAAIANERILAAYLLTEAKQKAWSALQEIILSLPPRVNADAGPHSMDEAKHMQEKALRIMAVDGLAEQAETSASARELLIKLGNETPDPSLKAYIQDKIADLPPL